MKNSNKNKETMISANLEKSLGDWKLPPSSASDIFKPRDSFGCFPDCRVKTVEKEIPLQEGSATFPLFSSYRKRVHQICYSIVHVGMIRVGLKPTKLCSNISAILCLRDMRFKKYEQSILGKVRTSLCDGPIYFSYFPGHCVALSDSCDSFVIDVKIGGSGVMRGDTNVTLMYRFHYRLVESAYLVDFSSRFPVDKKGETTVHITNIAQSNRVVSKTVSWDESAACEGPMVEEKLSSRGEAGSANVDWKETVKAHVLKVDVPGFKKEQVKVEVEGGRILQISGERSNEQEEGEGIAKWHCEERSGKFLRRIRLPENAKLDEVKAAVENGVLTVTVPKEEVDKKSQVKVIDVSG